MKKHLLKVLLLCAVALVFVSCDSDEEKPWAPPVVATTGVYVLNTGNWGTSDASLMYYDVESKTSTMDVFFNENDIKLGEVAQDMAIYGSKMYITVTNSNKIFVTDRNAKLLKTISPMNASNQPHQPRSALAHGGKVYVSTEDGCVLRVDTATMDVDSRIRVGSFCEQMTVVKNKLYITNSRENSKEVSTLDLANIMGEKIDIVVADNPAQITSDKDGNIFVITWGIWDDGSGNGTPSEFHKINTATNTSTKIGTNVASSMAISGDKVLLMSLDYNTVPFGTKFSYYNIKTGELKDESFITDGTVISNGSSINVDPVTGNIYIGTGGYMVTGKMYVFSPEGKRITDFSTGGYYPAGAYFLTETK